MVRKTILFLLTTISLVLISCGSDSKKFTKEPLDEIIKEYSQVKNMSIILHDMDYDESKKNYQHQYKILHQPIEIQKDTLIEKITDWQTVSDVFFKKNLDNMGMEIASKKDGVLKKIPAPPGFSNYVGNENYGQWKANATGTSFWEFYGQFAFMSSMFNLFSSPVGYNTWGDYRQNYRDRDRPYYGSKGVNYGTNSTFNKTSNPNSSWNNKPSSFKSKVRSKVQQSVAKSSRVRRSSSRYNQSRMRSRSGGFGK